MLFMISDSNTNINSVGAKVHFLPSLWVTPQRSSPWSLLYYAIQFIVPFTQ